MEKALWREGPAAGAGAGTAGSPIPVESEDDDAVTEDEGIAPAKEKDVVYKWQALEYKKQKILRAQEGQSGRAPQVDADDPDPDLGKVPGSAPRRTSCFTKGGAGGRLGASQRRPGTGGRRPTASSTSGQRCARPGWNSGS